jgi:polyisoprenoid-binding protein YceI
MGIHRARFQRSLRSLRGTREPRKPEIGLINPKESGEVMKEMSLSSNGLCDLRHSRGARSLLGMPMRLAILCLLASSVFLPVSRAQADAGPPVFKVSQEGSSIKFFVKASVALEGTFQKWDAAMTFTSPDLATGVLDIKIQADSVNTGSGMKDGKLKSKDFFDVNQNPLITFVSKKFVQTGPDTIEMDGDFTIRGVSKPEKLTFKVTGAGTGTGSITGTMAFDRKQYGMNSGIPFIKIADRVEVTVDLKGTRVSGPPVDLKK